MLPSLPGRLAAPCATLLALLVIVTACGTAAPSPTPVTTATASPSPTPTPSPTPSPTPVPTPTPSPTPIPLDQSLLSSRVTVLVVGIDSNEDRRSRNMPINTDAMLVASIDPDQAQISIVALPRDVVDLPLGNGATFPGKVNAIYRTYDVQTLRRALSATYQIPIDYYLEIDMADFGRLVTAVGGVDVTVTQTISDGHVGLYLPPGEHHLGANDAGRYVRSRYGTGGDYGRGWRQMEVLIELVRRATDPATDLDLLALARALSSLKTDIPFDKLPTFLELARRAADAKVVTQVLMPPRFGSAGFVGSRGWVMLPNLAEMRAFVGALMPGD
ncbi:MAG TPA: LCP family protein [Candidatus Limnocylindria bacterium]|nr:LCP family protein [Candidatus Limnocylindria bacterium]